MLCVNYSDGASVCLVSDVIYTLNLTLPSVITLIPVSSNLLRSTGGQLCLSELLSGQTERSEICTQLEYSVMAELYSAALRMYTENTLITNGMICFATVAKFLSLKVLISFDKQ